MVRVDSGPGCLHLKACEARNSSIVAPACGASKRGIVALMVPLWDFSPNARRKGLSLTSVVRSLGFPFFLGRSLDPLAQMPLGVAKPQARDLNGRVNIDYLLSWLRQSAADKVREALRTSPCTALSASNPPWLDA